MNFFQGVFVLALAVVGNVCDPCNAIASEEEFSQEEFQVLRDFRQTLLTGSVNDVRIKQTFRNSLLVKLMRESPDEVREFIINSKDSKALSPELRSLVEQRVFAEATLLVTEKGDQVWTDDQWENDEQPCEVYFEDGNKIFESGQYEIFGYRFDLLTESQCVIFIQTYESLEENNVAAEELTYTITANTPVEPWGKFNNVEHHVCLFVQEHETTKELVTDLENAMKIFFDNLGEYMTKLSHGKYKVTAEASSFPFPEGNLGVNFKANKNPIGMCTQQVRKTRPNMTSECSNYLFLVHNQRSFGFSGLGFVKAKGSVIKGLGAWKAKTLLHEYGHNMGLWHATSTKYYHTGNEYEDKKAIMGTGNLRVDYMAKAKYHLGWLPRELNTHVTEATKPDAPIRLYAHDLDHLPKEKLTMTFPIVNLPYNTKTAQAQSRLVYMFEYVAGCVSVRIVHSLESNKLNIAVHRKWDTKPWLKYPDICRGKECVSFSSMLVEAAGNGCMKEGMQYEDDQFSFTVQKTTSTTADIVITEKSAKYEIFPGVTQGNKIAAYKPTILASSEEDCVDECNARSLECGGFAYHAKGLQNSGGLNKIGDGACTFRTNVKEMVENSVQSSDISYRKEPFTRFDHQNRGLSYSRNYKGSYLWVTDDSQNCKDLCLSVGNTCGGFVYYNKGAMHSGGPGKIGNGCCFFRSSIADMAFNSVQYSPAVRYIQHEGKYLAGYCSYGSRSLDTLELAQEKCNEISDCGGVTFEHNKYTLRAGTTPIAYSRAGLVSYVKQADIESFMKSRDTPYNAPSFHTVRNVNAGISGAFIYNNERFILTTDIQKCAKICVRAGVHCSGFIFINAGKPSSGGHGGKIGDGSCFFRGHGDDMLLNQKPSDGVDAYIKQDKEINNPASDANPSTTATATATATTTAMTTTTVAGTATSTITATSTKTVHPTTITKEATVTSTIAATGIATTTATTTIYISYIQIPTVIVPHVVLPAITVGAEPTPSDVSNQLN